jgi:peptidoglycan/xylan/chitin deacetylase (PgdA/CDA1 family)
MPVREKILYLTFDDGPTPAYTPRILDLLKKYDAKATFFVCGKQAENNQHAILRISSEGHTIGNHTYQHLNGWKTNTGNYINDVRRSQMPAQSPFFRPPYGKLRIRQYLYLRKHYRIVMWDVMCMDFDRNISPETCFGYIREYAVPGSVVVFHDSEKAAANMLYALEQTLAVFGNGGYRFEALI